VPSLFIRTNNICFFVFVRFVARRMIIRLRAENERSSIASLPYLGCFRQKKKARKTTKKKPAGFFFTCLPQVCGRGEVGSPLVASGAYLPQFLQSEALRLTADGFFVDLELLQFLQFVCFIAFTSYGYDVRGKWALFAGKDLPAAYFSRVCA